MAVRVQVLGELKVFADDGAPLPIGGPRQKRLLAALVLRAPERAGVEWLQEVIWPSGEAVPEHPTETIRTYVARLRNVLGEDSISTGDGSYGFSVDDGAIDARQFERLIDDGRSAANSADERARTLESALDLWHGEPFDTLAGTEPFNIEHRRLSELRMCAREAFLEARLELGDDRFAIAELEALVLEEPLRETPRRLLMLALHHVGAQAEALRTYQSYRKLLAEELGLEPSPELSELERSIATRDPAASRLPARALGAFELDEEIGSGDFGTVYRARQPILDREVAVKMIRKEFADSPEFIHRFDVEAQVIARLEHPNIVPLYDYWRDPSGAYLVMRYLAGGTLADRFARGPQSVATASRWLTQIGAALASAHRAGVVHRDLRPQNIFFDLDGNAFLGDFGIAALQGQGDPEHPASLGSGSAYSSPEALRNDPIGPRADVYGLAVLLYEALTGRHPSNAVDGDPALPALLSSITSTALADDPDARYSEVGGFVSAVIEAVTGPVQAPASVEPISPRTNPYRGLRAFDEADAGLFFGREDTIGAICGELRDHRFAVVIGPSGSGKSSVVRAGVVPEARSGGSFVVTMTPGRDPFAELATALLRIAVDPTPAMIDRLTDGPSGLAHAIRRSLPTPDGHALLVIDQFEELYTLVADEGLRTKFLDGIVAAVEDRNGQLSVLLTLRADFYDRPLRHPKLGRLVVDHQITALPLSSAELERTISQPAHAAGVDVDPALIAALVQDTLGEVQALPMLQYTLTELFERREFDSLRLDDYVTFGGLNGAIASRAEEIHDRLTAAAKAVAAEVFTELVTLGEGTEDTRRRTPIGDLSDEVGVEEILTLFGDARLLTFDSDPATRAPTVEVAHEALIREWPRFRHWVDDNRDHLRVGRQVAQAAALWEEGGRDEDELLRGGRLETAIGWLAHAERTVPDTVRRFVEAGERRQNSEQERERRTNRRLRRLVAAVGVVAVLALVAGGIAALQQRRAETEARQATEARSDAETRRLSADAARLATSNRRVALLLAAEAYRRDPNANSLGGLQTVLTATEGFLGYVGASSDHRAVDWINDRNVITLTGSEMQIIDTESGLISNRLVVGAAEGMEHDPSSGTVAVWTGSSMSLYDRNLELVAGPHIGSSDIESVAFHPTEGVATGHRDGSIAFWVAGSEEPAWTMDAHPEETADAVLTDGLEAGNNHQPESFRIGTIALAFNSDGTRLASGSLVVARIWEVASLSLIDEHRSTRTLADGLIVATGVVELEIDRNDRLVIASAFGISVRDLDGENSIEVGLDSRSNSVSVLGVLSLDVELGAGVAAFGRDGGQVGLIRYADDPPTQTELRVDAQLPGAPSIALHSDGDRVAFGARDGIAILSLTEAGVISRVVPIGNQTELTITDDGKMLSASSPDRQAAEIWSLAGPQPELLEFPHGRQLDFAWVGFGDRIYGWTFDPVGTFFAFDDRLVEQFRLSRPSVLAIDVSDDKGLVAIGRVAQGEDGGVVDVYDSESGELVATLHELSEITGTDISSRKLDFDPVRDRLVATTEAGAAIVWDTTTWSAQHPPLSRGGGSVLLASFSNDGGLMATVDDSGALTLRDSETFQPVQRLAGNTDAAEGFSYGPFFTADGRYLITTSDGLGRIWDIAEGVQVGVTLPSDPSTSGGASMNGRWLAMIDEGGAVVWDLDLDAWFDRACRAAGRNLTQTEWDQFGPADVAYAQTCPQWPSLAELDTEGEDDE